MPARPQDEEGSSLSWSQAHSKWQLGLGPLGGCGDGHAACWGLRRGHKGYRAAGCWTKAWEHFREGSWAAMGPS